MLACSCPALWCDVGIMLTLALPKCFLLPYLRQCYHQNTSIWTAASGYFVYFYLIVRSPLTAILQLRGAGISDTIFYQCYSYNVHLKDVIELLFHDNLCYGMFSEL